MYDKALEQSVNGLRMLEEPLTRVEYTYKPKGKEGREVNRLSIEEDMKRRYHILNLIEASENEKTTLLRLTERKKSSLSKKQRLELEQLVTKHEISFEGINTQTALSILKLLNVSNPKN